MTIEELKTLAKEPAIWCGDLAKTQNVWVDLAPEILALVEAAEDARLADTNARGIELILGDALDAFNAKLAEL